MKGVSDLLDFERRVWPRQIPSTEMRLAKCQVQKPAAARPQDPTAGTHFSLRRWKDRGETVMPYRRTSSTSLVQSSTTCCGGSCGAGGE